MNKPYRLLAPGPVPVPRSVLERMSEKLLHHRTPAFEKILLETWAGLQYVFSTRQAVQILTGTGSAAMEAAVLNTLSPGDQALVVVSGKFGERWAEICERYGVKTERWNLEWGRPASAPELSARLKANPRFKAVFTQVCETSTATVHPIQKMAEVVRQDSTALFAVDAITAVGCMPLPMDEWQLDVVIAGSQKAFMIPTGLSFIAMSERAWSAQKNSKLPKYYFDLALEKKANDRKETHFSTPTPLVTGLSMVVNRMREVGLDKVIARCALLARNTREFGKDVGLGTFSNAPSDSVTALTTPTDSAKLRDQLEKDDNITVMGGQDQLKGKILRVGHMGDVRDEDMLALFAALATKLGKPFDEAKYKTNLSSVGTLFQ
ncbi:MAG TPA: alanine--glyoxylate aminotransferase family protein [Bdellovibrionales bacterium]|nr:alanine--glyoxylate aminotransferase family protein [Bdellovibrionales bacterium]